VAVVAKWTLRKNFKTIGNSEPKSSMQSWERDVSIQSP